MKIILSKNAGFCPGVKRADAKVRELIESKKENDLIFTLGPLIHNRIYVSSLEDRGVKSIKISEDFLDEASKTLLNSMRQKGKLSRPIAINGQSYGTK